MGISSNYTLMSAAGDTSAAVTVLRGLYQWSIWGTWDGATAALQWRQASGAAWIGVGPDAEASADALGGVAIADGDVRVLVTTPGGSTSLTAWLGGIE